MMDYILILFSTTFLLVSRPRSYSLETDTAHVCSSAEVAGNNPSQVSRWLAHFKVWRVKQLKRRRYENISPWLIFCPSDFFQKHNGANMSLFPWQIFRRDPFFSELNANNYRQYWPWTQLNHTYSISIPLITSVFFSDNFFPTTATLGNRLPL